MIESKFFSLKRNDDRVANALRILESVEMDAKCEITRGKETKYKKKRKREREKKKEKRKTKSRDSGSKRIEIDGNLSRGRRYSGPIRFRPDGSVRGKAARPAVSPLDLSKFHVELARAGINRILEKNVSVGPAHNLFTAIFSTTRVLESLSRVDTRES